MVNLCGKFVSILYECEVNVPPADSTVSAGASLVFKRMPVCVRSIISYISLIYIRNLYISIFIIPMPISIFVMEQLSMGWLVTVQQTFYKHNYFVISENLIFCYISMLLYIMYVQVMNYWQSEIFYWRWHVSLVSVVMGDEQESWFFNFHWVHSMSRLLNNS